MLNIRKSEERGRYRNDWLDSRHTFSFGEYYDPRHMGVSLLRVINEDRVAPGAGFPTHPHRDMEIVSYVLDGELEHRDSMGNGSVIRAGDVQRMSAGTGVTHSEFNPSNEQPTHFLQIWLMPARKQIEPGYEQKFFEAETKRAKLKLLVSPDGRNGSISANTDALVYASTLKGGESVTYDIPPGRLVYVHVASGFVTVGGQKLAAGDGATISAENRAAFVGDAGGELLLFDLPEIGNGEIE